MRGSIQRSPPPVSTGVIGAISSLDSLPSRAGRSPKENQCFPTSRGHLVTPRFALSETWPGLLTAFKELCDWPNSREPLAQIGAIETMGCEAYTDYVQTGPIEVDDQVDLRASDITVGFTPTHLPILLQMRTGLKSTKGGSTDDLMGAYPSYVRAPGFEGACSFRFR